MYSVLAVFLAAQLVAGDPMIYRINYLNPLIVENDLNHKSSGYHDVDLESAMMGLELGLQFLDRNVHDLNLDGVAVTRMIEGELSSLLLHRPHNMSLALRHRIENIRDTARGISNIGRNAVHIHQPRYSMALGAIMEEPVRLLWYPSVVTTTPAHPVSCAQSRFNKKITDPCFSNIMSLSRNRCVLTQLCAELMTRRRQRSYMLTHQVLYWQVYEKMGCVDKVSLSLRARLCSDVMRDAKEIAAARYPKDTRDLFVEQISLCGMWGFRDFANREWLRNIRSWQGTNGCFVGEGVKVPCWDKLKPDHIRKKRNEKIVEGRCLVHQSSLSLLAMAVNIRFLIE